MFSNLAAAAERHVPATIRSRYLLVCTGAAAAFLGYALALPELSGQRTFLIGLAVLMSSMAITTWAFRRIAESEARLLAARNEAEYLDKANADLRQFALAVAHDLRAPLVSAAGLLDMAKENAECGDVDDLMHLLDRASATARRMDDLISGLLDLATGDETDQDGAVNLDGAVRTALEDLAPAISKLSVDVLCHEPLGEALGDPRYVQQAIDNILGNALKYGRPIDPSETAIIEISAERLTDGVRLCIADNGPGIPKMEHSSLLGSRRRAPGKKKPNQGAVGRPLSGGNAGLGLGLVRQAMAECGGGLSIRTSSMGGAEFVLDFRAESCAIPSTPPRTLPKDLPTQVLSDHTSSSSRMMQTTG